MIFNGYKRYRKSFYLSIIILLLTSFPLFSEFSFDAGTQIISAVPQYDLSGSNVWLEMSWADSYYFSESLSYFIDSALRTGYTPLMQSFEGIATCNNYLSFRKNSFLSRLNISGYYDFTIDSDYTSPVWQINTDVFISYGNYQFSVYINPGLSLLQNELSNTLDFNLTAGAVYALFGQILIKPGISAEIPAEQTTGEVPGISPFLDLSWYTGIPLTLKSKINYRINFSTDQNNIVLTWIPEATLLLKRGITATVRSKAEYKTYQTSTLPDGSIAYLYDPTFKLLPELLSDFSLTDKITLHAKTTLGWTHYYNTEADDITAGLSLDIEIEF